MLVLPATLTHAQAPACRDMLVQALRSESGPQAVVDASQLAVFDSSALAVLLDCRREALVRGKTFAAQRLPQKLGELAVLYGVGELLPTASA